MAEPAQYDEWADVPVTEAREIVRALSRGLVDAFVVAENQSERVVVLDDPDTGHRIQQLRGACEALERSEREYRTVFELATVGMVQVDLATRRFIRVNRRMCQITGYSPQELFDRGPAELTHPEDRPAIDLLFEQLCSGEIDEYSAERRYLHKSGETRWITVSGISERDARGTPVRSIGIVQDVTQRKLMEQQLLAQQRELQQANEELQNFANVVAHDLRSPLLSINGCVELLGDQHAGGLSEEGRELIHYVRDAVSSMGRLIQSLLSFTRMGSNPVELTDCDMNAVAYVARHNLRSLIKDAQAQLTCHELPPVRGDATLLGQLLQNLIENAIKYRGGAPPEICLSARRADAEWEFAVRDNGVGIDNAQLDRIFKPFHRVSGTASCDRGVGLGLATCKRIIERHGGRIWVESRPGAGSTFYFTLQPV